MRLNFVLKTKHSNCINQVVNQLTTKQLDKQNKELDKLTKCKYNSISKTRTKEHEIQLDKQKYNNSINKLK